MTYHTRQGGTGSYDDFDEDEDEALMRARCIRRSYAPSEDDDDDDGLLGPGLEWNTPCGNEAHEDCEQCGGTGVLLCPVCLHTDIVAGVCNGCGDVGSIQCPVCLG